MFVGCRSCLVCALFDAEAMPELVGHPYVNEAQDQNVDWNLELDVQKYQHDNEKDEKPGCPVTWSHVHFESISDRDVRRHGPTNDVRLAAVQSIDKERVSVGIRTFHQNVRLIAIPFRCLRINQNRNLNNNI